ncbi:MAG: ComF family protein [Phycisphaerales bacterium]|nr:ComF family protein [Phycisphaerales bacterium]
MVSRVASRWYQRFIRTLAVAERQLFASRIESVRRLPIPDAPDVWCHRCGATRSARGVISCRHCAGIRLERERTLRLGTYDSRWRDLIIEVKHSADRALARTLGRLLAQQLLCEARNEPIALDSAIIVPVPMPLARRIERGIDHTSELAKGISTATGIRVAHCLSHHAGPVQAELAESMRRARLQRIIWRGNGSTIPVRSVVFLVDDVLTTGSTLLQASNAIRSALPLVTIIALVVAVTDKRRNA